MGTYLVLVILTHLGALTLSLKSCPPNLQEKWLSAGSKYKEQHRVCFLPFSLFADFVSSQAKSRNDRSFILTNSSRTCYCNEKPIAKHDGVKTAISVHKMDMLTTPGSSSMQREEMDNKPSMYCPVHNKSYPLEKCTAFKMKQLTESKKSLKEHRQCFRCCSATHLARECKVGLKCNECKSDHHCSAMHSDISLSPATSPVMEPDTEQNNCLPEVTSRCTEVCGEGLLVRRYAW